MKKLTFVLFCLLTCFLIPFSASAAELLKVEELTYEGETFELETWIGQDGLEYITVSTDVEDKVGISNYLAMRQDRLNKKPINKFDPDVSTAGKQFNWSRTLSNTDYDGKFKMTTDGYSEIALLKPATADFIRVGDGNFRSDYTGSGNADKIINYYDYTFNGTTVAIAKAPVLTLTSRRVSWKSEPVANAWYLEHKTLWAEGTSRTLITSVEIEGGADIYKGSKIYRPYDYVKIAFGQI